MLGAAIHTDERLEIDLQWIDAQLGDIPYGVDLMMPSNYVGAATGGMEHKALREYIPDGHRQFVEKLLADAGVPELPDHLTASKKERGLRYSRNRPKVLWILPLPTRPGFW